MELRLPVAGLSSRSLAWLIDAIIKGVALTVGTTVLSIMGNFGDALSLIGIFLGLWFYNVLFEVFNQGATPGKSAMGLRVMNANGTPVGWTGSMIRNLLRARRARRATARVVSRAPRRQSSGSGQSGMFPCFLGGLRSTFVLITDSAVIRRGRVKRGSKMSSMYPSSAATNGFANFFL